MKNIGIFYGSSTGTTAEIAQRIAKALGAEANCFDVSNASVSDALQFDTLILGSSTWGIGELQDDMADFIPNLAKEDLSGTKIALFGCGDADSYPDSFCEALAEIKNELSSSGCTFIGTVVPEGYSYDATRCEEDGKLIGLCLDEVNQSDLTDERINAWISALESELA